MRLAHHVRIQNRSGQSASGTTEISRAYSDHPEAPCFSFFDVTGDERKAMLALLDSAKLRLDIAFHPDGYNAGINDGECLPHAEFLAWHRAEVFKAPARE